MILEKFYLGCLAHASYLIGSEGVAAVVDPQRDVDLYLEAAGQHGLRIAHIIETHLHADFVSGHQELARRTGATIYLGQGSGATFAHRAVRDGDAIAVGKCRLGFLQTPGHTLESICVVVTDTEHGAQPAGVLTGDTLFIGDVGRPDLSETYSPQQLAGMLYDSLHEKLLRLPDETAVYPAHGAGSMCGRNISAERSSTIGREKQFNYALRPMSREQFVASMTQDLPARPEYFFRDANLNRRGAAALSDLPTLESLAANEVLRRQRTGLTVLDTRPAMAFCSGHIPGAIQIGLGGQFASWAGAVLGLDRDLMLVAEDQRTAEEARMRLARVGIERVSGALGGGIPAWARAGLPLAHTEQITVQDLSKRLASDAGLCVVDVRRKLEFDAGHIHAALLHPLDRLRETMDALPRNRPLAVHCKSGYRSVIGCSLLQASGFTDVINVQGGFDAWAAAGLPAAG